LYGRLLEEGSRQQDWTAGTYKWSGDRNFCAQKKTHQLPIKNNTPPYLCWFVLLFSLLLHPIMSLLLTTTVVRASVPAITQVAARALSTQTTSSLMKLRSLLEDYRQHK
jgi:hypothetical protein